MNPALPKDGLKYAGNIKVWVDKKSTKIVGEKGRAG